VREGKYDYSRARAPPALAAFCCVLPSDKKLARSVLVTKTRTRMPTMMNDRENNTKHGVSWYDEYYVDASEDLNKEESPVFATKRETAGDVENEHGDMTPSHNDMTKHECAPNLSGMSTYFEFISDERDEKDDGDEADVYVNQETFRADGAADGKPLCSEKKHVPPVSVIGISTYYEYDCDDTESDLPVLYDAYGHDDEGCEQTPNEPLIHITIPVESHKKQATNGVSMYDEYGYDDLVQDIIRGDANGISVYDEFDYDDKGAHKTIVSLGDLARLSASKHSEHGAASPTGIVSLYDEYDCGCDYDWLDNLSTLSCPGTSIHDVDELDVEE